MLHKKFAIWMVVVGALMFVAGCGQSPVVSDGTDQEAMVEIASDQDLAQLSKPGIEKGEHRGKGKGKGKGDNETQGVIGADGGVLMLSEPSTSDEDRLDIWFLVKPGSLESEHQITMSYDGQTLSSLKIYFGPKGLDFKPAAKLQVKIGEERVDLFLKQLRVLHHSSEGVEIAPHEIDYVEGGAIIDVEVSGFSRFEFDD